MKTYITHGFIVDQSFLVSCIIAFLAIALFFLLIIMMSRVVKTQVAKRREILRDKLQRKINAIIFSKDGSVSKFPWNFHLMNIRSLLPCPSDKQLMIDLIISNKQNLLGHYAIILRKIYIRLGLKRFSIGKLSHRSSLIKIKGLQELAQMEIDDSLPLMKNMFYRSNKKVRQEVFTAMVRIGGSWPFSLITEYAEPIAGWMKVVIHKHLSTLPVHQLPKFYEWLASTNPSVRAFAIEMIKHFQQLEAADTLASLLQNDDQDLAVMAADALSELGVHQYANEIMLLGRKNMHHERRTIKIIRSLGKIGNENNKEFLAFHMIHGPYRIRFAAMQALLKLKIPVLDQRIDFNINHDNDFDDLYQHLTDPLLR